MEVASFCDSEQEFMRRVQTLVCCNIYKCPDHPDVGVLRLTPWRIYLAQFPTEPLIWRAAP
jgi:hypothetical protein